ncbi:MAG: protoheme IX farnesyltransferase, partial [Actinobacteria bacterium]|nr:protoheme IX farnesyltransferase [Actinomycetota bacterium]
AASLVVLAVSFRGEPLPLGPARDYLTLTKPRIMSLLLLTGAAGMFVGAGGVPGGAALAAMLLGLALACGGASALNHVMDRDIDRLMGARTASRPVASGRVPAPRALEFGLVLSALSFALLASTVNVLTAVLALVGNLFYVIVYTGYLKRTTDQNIVIGGAAGAVPPLVGYAAATGSLALPALWLFLIVFLWTPPHFWALALMLKEHYRAAGVPMLPGTRGDEETTRQILLYSLVLVGFTLLAGVWLGLVYTVVAGLLGGYLVLLAQRLRVDATRRNAVVLFHFSLAYLALLFVAAAIDPVIL